MSWVRLARTSEQLEHEGQQHGRDHAEQASLNSTRPCSSRPQTSRAGMKAPISSAPDRQPGRAGHQRREHHRDAARARVGDGARAAMMPGIAQAKLDSSGMKERPTGRARHQAVEQQRPRAAGSPTPPAPG